MKERRGGRARYAPAVHDVTADGAGPRTTSACTRARHGRPSLAMHARSAALNGTVAIECSRAWDRSSRDPAPTGR